MFRNIWSHQYLLHDLLSFNHDCRELSLMSIRYKLPLKYTSIYKFELFKLPKSIHLHRNGFNPMKICSINLIQPIIINIDRFVPTKILQSKYGRSKFSFYITGIVNENVIHQIKLLENKCRKMFGIKIKSIASTLSSTINAKINMKSSEYSGLNFNLLYISDWSGKTLEKVNNIEIKPNEYIIQSTEINNLSLILKGIYLKNGCGKLLSFITSL